MFFEKTSAKRRALRLTALLIAAVTALTALSSCSIKYRYNKYDRDGQKYDYDLTEYISIPEYKGIEIPDIVYEATSEEIEDNKYKKLAYFAEEYVVKDGVAEKYDLVVADFTCTIDGYDYRDLCSYVNESYRNFMAGIKYFMVPEIDEAVLGMAPGETKEFDFVFPEPYYKDPSVSGLTGHYKITLQTIRRQDFPEYDDDFVSTYYGADSADAYTDEIKEQLEHDIGNCLQDYEVDLVWDYIVSNSKLKKIPSKEFAMMNDYETNYYIKQASKAKKSLAEYATEDLGYESVNDLYDVITEYAQSAVKDEMILYIISRCENITLTDDEYNEALVNLGKEYEASDIETCEQLAANEYGSLEEFRRMTLLNKVYKYVAENAVKIDCDEYYANKAAGKYKVDPDAIGGIPRKQIYIIIVLAAVLILLVVFVILLAKAIKAKKRHTQAKIEREAVEKKRRLRRELKEQKKKKHDK